MSSLDLLRLRVSVQRHGVPEVKLIWPCPRSHDLTVSKFLSLVNEVMPLESGEWGLEDYVVELTDGAGESYECLHFQPVPHILKNDDHVLIRCLHGEDLKRRRLSGRHQISADGRHLVDGLVFGRPWLRTPRDRPALELPPRKRARTARDYGSNYDFEDEDEYGLIEVPQPRLLPERAQQETSGEEVNAEGSDDSDEFLDQDLDEDVEEEMDDASGEGLDDLAQELENLIDDNLAVGHDMPTGDPGNASSNGQVEEPPAPSPGGLDLRALDGIVALREAFPQMPAVAIEVELLRQRKDLRKAYDALSGSHEPTLCFEEMMEKAVIRLLFAGQAPAWGTPDDNAMLPRSNTARPLIQVVESSNVPGDAAAATPPRATSISTTDEATDGETDNTEYTAEDINASDITSSDGTSSEGADSSHDLASSSNDDDGGSDDSDGDGDSDSDSESDSDSDDDSDSDPSDDDSGAPVDKELSHDEDSSGGSSSGSSGSDGSESDFSSSDDGTGASTGQQAAQNAPREGGNVDASGEPSGAPPRLTKTQKRNARRRRTLARMQAEQNQCSDEKSDEVYAALEVRKQQLLRMVSERASLAENSQNPQAAQDDDGDAEKSQDGDAPSAEPIGRRSRVDVGAGRRLLFGSLGLKVPKTRADEEKIKQGLMQDVRPLQNIRLVEGETAGEKSSAAAERDIEDWRQTVTYRAVECSRQGMVLSEPPFPFEQRWDPQQQGRARRKRRRTAQEFFEEYDGDDDSGLYMEEDIGRTKRIKGLMSDPFGLDVTSDEAAPGKTLSSETEGRNTARTTAQTDDVPPLPADVGSLADLEAGGAKEGMVITWKQIAMSKATRWQPMVVQQTGTVLAGGDARNVYVVLAMRDRQDRSKTYDENGKRVYDKFEMPEADSDDEGEDDGERMVSWAEMTEPKIVRMPDEDK